MTVSSTEVYFPCTCLMPVPVYSKLLNDISLIQQLLSRILSLVPCHQIYTFLTTIIFADHEHSLDGLTVGRLVWFNVPHSSIHAVLCYLVVTFSSWRLHHLGQTTSIWTHHMACPVVLDHSSALVIRIFEDGQQFVVWKIMNVTVVKCFGKPKYSQKITNAIFGKKIR